MSYQIKRIFAGINEHSVSVFTGLSLEALPPVDGSACFIIIFLSAAGTNYARRYSCTKYPCS